MGCASADGLTESRSEPAAIDELLTAGLFERPQPAATTAETVAADLAHTPHDIPIVVNSKVLSYVELFQGRLRDFMQAGLERAQRYLPMIQRVFKSEGVPLDLAYVPLVESAFKNTALSRASARGMWQFMLGTGARSRARSDLVRRRARRPRKGDARRRPVSEDAQSRCSTATGTSRWRATTPGQAGCRARVRRSKKTDYWEITASTRYLPRETREYVPMILAAIIIAKNPVIYGFEIGAAAPLAYEIVSVPGALPLTTIAEWVDLEIEHLQDLNPDLRRTTTPMTSHDLKVPIGTSTTIQGKLASIDTSEYRSFRFHTVKRGETLATIARRYNLTSAQLRDANDLRTTKVARNQTLMIPQRPAPALPTAAASRASSTPPPTRTMTGASGSTSSSSPQTYRVRQGDTLYSIARQFGTTIDDLRRLNQLSSDRIKIGDRIKVRR